MNFDLASLVGQIRIHEGDIDNETLHQASTASMVGVDTETSGLDWRNERLLLCQLHVEGDVTHLVRIQSDKAPLRLIALLESPSLLKVFHHAMFDLRFLVSNWRCHPNSVACSKICSKLLYPDRKEHRLQSLASEYLGLHLSKDPQRSDWSAQFLSGEQAMYAALDAAVPTRLFPMLKADLVRVGRWKLAQQCFDFLGAQVELDLLGCPRVFEY